MNKTLLIMVSAVICGILAMFVPLYLWHLANFPGEPATLPQIREESLGYFKALWWLQERTSITPLHITLAISFAISIAIYVFLKRRF